MLNKLKNAVWTKVRQLKAGAIIAIEKDGKLDWDEIISIKKVGRERVYDIEVEGTHNFVGNGIIAHNTYISGNVGIGTTAPTTQLHIGTNTETHTLSTSDVLISSDLELDGVLYLDGETITDSSGATTVLFASDPNAEGKYNLLTNGSWLIENTSSTSSNNLASLIVNQGNAEDIFTASASGVTKFTITSVGNVGIGTTAPVSKLHIEGTNAAGILTLSNTDTDIIANDELGQINYYSNDPSGTPGTRAQIKAVATDNHLTGNNPTALTFSTTFSSLGEKMRIDSNGNVGIGTTNPGHKLDIWGSTMRLYDETEVNDLIMSNSGDAASLYYTDVGIGAVGGITFEAPGLTNVYGTDSVVMSTAAQVRLTVLNNGNVGIGMTGPSVALDVTGSIEYTGTITDVSDAKLKENFQTISDPLEKILSLNAFKFNMIGNDPSDIELGYKAQDVQNILPELVSIVDPENNYLGVNYIGIIPIITEAIKELNAKIFNQEYLTTKIISPITNSDLIVDLQPDNNQEASKLVIKGENDEEVISFDASGDATISGTLYADDIESEKLKKIEELLHEVETNQRLLTEAQNWDTNTATTSASLSASDSGQFKDLFVTNQAAMTSLFISDNLTTKAINSLDSVLGIQSLAAMPVEIMAGKIKIDTSGNVYFEGNVEIAGDLTINNLVVANSPTSEESEPPSEVSTGEITTNAIAGKAILSAGQTEIKINNPKLKTEGLIYVTPVSSTQNKVLYVKSKDVGTFTIGFNEAIDTEVEFNWWIIDIKSNNI